MVIKAIIFDFGGVIVNDTDPYIFRDISTKFNIEYELTVSTINELVEEYQTGRISDDEFWREFSQKVGRDLPKGYESLPMNKYVSETRKNPKVSEIITKLRKNGYKLAILSNTIAPHVKYNREKGYYKSFDVVVLSCEVGMRKPDQEIYELLTKRLGIEPRNCVYIDDKQQYLEPAQNLEMKTILFKDAEQLKNGLIKLGVKL